MTFARYLTYRIKNSALRTIIFSLISVAIVLYTVAELNYINCLEDFDEIPFKETGIYMLAIVMGVFATVIPMLETACFKNRRNIDTLYSMPIRRGQLGLAHYLSGFIQVFFIYSACFFTSYIYLSVKTDYYELKWMMLYYLLSILLGFVLYSIFIFLFSEANTVLDGVIISALWVFALWLLISAARRHLNVLNIIDHYAASETQWIQGWGIIYAPINNLTVIFQELIEINKIDVNLAGISRYAKWIPCFIAWGVLGITAAVGYFYNILRKGAENAGEVSDSWFGYPLLIPLYALSVLMLFGNFDIASILIIASALIGYIVYRRRFKLKLADYIMLAIILMFSFIVG